MKVIVYRFILDCFIIKIVLLIRKYNWYFVVFSLEDKFIFEIKLDIKWGIMVGIDVGIIDCFIIFNNELFVVFKYLIKVE